MLRVLIVKKIVSYRPSSIVMYYDASNITCDAYSVEIESKVFHKMLNDFESFQSSTWREMRAIEQALYYTIFLTINTLNIISPEKKFSQNFRRMN
jgi:hypothetical protein